MDTFFVVKTVYRIQQNVKVPFSEYFFLMARMTDDDDD